MTDVASAFRRKDAAAFRRKGAVAWAIGGILLTAILLVQAETKALRPFGNDFTAYLDAARALADGRNPYLASERFPYSYPLTLAWLLISLAYLPIWIAAAAWFAISGYAYWRVVNVASTEDGRFPDVSRATALAVAIAIALLQIVQNELLNGQVNLVVCAASLAAIAWSQNRRPVPAAILWGAAISLKLFPLILAPWFLLRRRWRELSLAPPIAAALALVPVLWTGSEALHWTRDYLGRIASGEAGRVDVPDFIHLNVAWTIAHHLGIGRVSGWLALGSAIALVTAAMIADVKRGFGGGVRAAAGYLALVVLLSPKSETHHMIFTVPAVVVLAARARTWPRIAWLGALIVTFNIGFVTPAVRDPFLVLFGLGVAAWCIAE